MSIVGFDFGTTNSLISLVRGDRAINYLDDEQRPIPSVVCYEGQKKIVGRAAKERLAQSGLGIQGNSVRSPKMYLGRESVFMEGVERSPVEIVADVVRHVLAEARGRGGKDLKELTGAVVTIPVDMKGYQRRALRDAFRLAGLNIVQFVHEPLAALYGYFRNDLDAMLRRYDRKLVLVFDWGGGTLDLTLCRPLGARVVQIRNDGTDAVGGDEFDQLVMNSLVQQVCTSLGITDGYEVQPGAKARLLDRCERAKIDLSTRANSQVYVGNYFRGGKEEDFDCSLSQDGLEALVAPLLDKGFKRIEMLLEDAGFAPEQVALCVATGGMSNMPAVKRRLHALFGPERVQIPDGTATLIAEGAAWIAADRAALQLAKDVELSLARGSYLPLIKAGTLLPREGQVQSQPPFHIYCTDPRDGLAKFQICSPEVSERQALPGEPRKHLEILTVKVDEQARAFQERLELNIRINDDLIMEVHARSLTKKDQDRKEIHDLEFGLSFPKSGLGGSQGDPGGKGGSRKEPRVPGTLSLRANVADHQDLELIPGEFLYTYQPDYFDRRRNPPEFQNLEKLYYQPCSLCGRASHDPLCKCASLLPDPYTRLRGSEVRGDR